MLPIDYRYLTDLEKNEILVSRIRENEAAIYRMEVQKVELEALGDSSKEMIDMLNTQINTYSVKNYLLLVEQQRLLLSQK